MNIQVFDDAAQVAKAAADRFVLAAEKKQGGRFDVALAGGSTPRALYTLLSQSPYRDSIDWNDVRFYFGDERCVPPDHPDSNFRMAEESLLRKVPLAAEQIHRIQCELPPLEAAERYATELRPLGIPPRFDLVLLGMGPDGHTASLFPGTKALGETRASVVAVHVPQLDTWRVTLTAPVLSAAREVLVTVAGKEKADALQQALEGPAGSVPIQLVQPDSITFLVDRAAASKLTR